MRIDWSPLALERVESIASFIAEDDPIAAERWVDELFESVKRLADFPDSGRVVPEVGLSRIRELIFGPYRVIYKVSDNVEILTVRHGRQLLRFHEVDEKQ